ncbi:MAG: dienelactone hydrolase family protein [Steroidobacteraceae bacterium]
MCDESDFDEMLEQQDKALSRRKFGALTAAAGLVTLLPPAADAVTVTGTDVNIKTPDGTADAYFVHPTRGAHPGILMWPDIFGLRPAFKQMARRLAQSGYAVLVVNPFYRIEHAPTSPPHPDFRDPATRKRLTELMTSLTPERIATDAHSYVPFLDRQRSVSKRRKMGTTGYCMGGPFTFRTAAAFPARIGAVCTFHGANLVTQGADSPHLLIPRTQAQYLICISASDDEHQPEAKTVLRETFAKAHLHAQVEVFTGTKHGWCVIDSAVYDRAPAQKAWSQQLALLKRALA